MLPPLKELQSDILRFVIKFYKEQRYPAIMSDITKRFHITQQRARDEVRMLDKIGYVDWIVEGRRTRAIFPLWKE